MASSKDKNQRAVEHFCRKRQYPSVVDLFAGAAEVEIDAVLISQSIHERQMRGTYPLTTWHGFMYFIFLFGLHMYLLLLDNIYLLFVITTIGISRQKAWRASLGAENCPAYA